MNKWQIIKKTVSLTLGFSLNAIMIFTPSSEIPLYARLTSAAVAGWLIGITIAEKSRTAS